MKKESDHRVENEQKVKKIFYILVSLLIAICLFRNLSFTAYNIRPIRECNNYLEKVYGKKFRRAREPVVYYREDGYHIWKIKYIDDTGMEFYEYYEHPYESSEDGFYAFYGMGFGERGVRDYYWSQQLQQVYGETFQLEQYRNSEPSIVKYQFEITDEDDISRAADIIAALLKYTFDNVEIISEDMVGYVITYNGQNLYTIYRDMEELLKLRYQDEECIYQYIYDKIYEKYRNEIYGNEREMSNQETERIPLGISQPIRKVHLVHTKSSIL